MCSFHVRADYFDPATFAKQPDMLDMIHHGASAKVSFLLQRCEPEIALAFLCVRDERAAVRGAQARAVLSNFKLSLWYFVSRTEGLAPTLCN